MPDLTIADDIRHLIGIARIRIAPVLIRPSSSPLLHEMEELEQALLSRHLGRSPGEIEQLAAARELYRSFRIDPTRTRPSSEALLRRVLQGKPMPRLLNAVDLCNLLSLRLLLPLGLYDESRIEGSVVLRRGGPGESYAGIRKDLVSLEGKPVLADSLGPFGNPTSDSLRTCVTPGTTRLWLVIYAPSSGGSKSLENSAHAAQESLLHNLVTPEAEPETDILILV